MSTQPNETSDWLTLAEAAARLGVHPTTLRRWANQGNLPVTVTPGGHRRFIDAKANLRLLRRIKSLLNTVQLAITEAFELGRKV